MKSFFFISIHPQFLESYFSFGVMAKARQNGHHLEAIDLRRYAFDKRGSVDDVPYGGGDGMVMRPEPLRDAVLAIKKTQKKCALVLPSPGARPFKQADSRRFAEDSVSLVFICGRFGGVDQRFIDHYVDYEYSLGDYVVSGGELPSLMMADSILREMPNILGHKESCQNDSFGEGFSGRLEHPLYTRPREFESAKVPCVLHSGDHKKIAAWRQEASLEKTGRLRPDLL